MDVEQLTEARKKESKELFVMVDKALFNLEINEFELTLYVIIDAMRINFYGSSYLNVDEIIRILGLFKNSQNIKKVKDTLLKLEKMNLIHIYTSLDCEDKVSEIETKTKYYMVRTEKEYSSYQGFVKVYYEDIQKMLATNVKYKDKLIQIYINILSYIFYTNTNNRVAFPTVEKIAANTGFDKKTVMKYIGVLCENEVLACLQLFYEDKTFNYYSRKIHEAELKWEAKERIEQRKEKYGYPRTGYKSNA